jgi:hypothetical protein
MRKPRFWRVGLVGILPANFAGFLVYASAALSMVFISFLGKMDPWFSQSLIFDLRVAAIAAIALGAWVYAISHSDGLQI